MMTCHERRGTSKPHLVSSDSRLALLVPSITCAANFIAAFDGAFPTLAATLFVELLTAIVRDRFTSALLCSLRLDPRGGEDLL